MLLTAAWLLSLSAQALSEARQFVTVRRSGTIWIMPPLGSDWQKLRTANFDEGSLLRLDPGSSIELKQTGRTLSAAETEARLRIAEPMIVRLDRHIFKELRFKDYVVDGLWNEGASQEKEATGHPLLSFGAAFVRHLLSIETAQELPKLKADPQKENLESARKISNLALLSPGQDSLHFISDRTAQIPLYWESPNDHLRFKIFLWPAGDIKREPLATVQGHRYLLTIREPGSYRLQISSVDYHYRSEVLRLNVDRPLAFIPAEDPLSRELTKAGIRQSPTLQIQYPPQDLEIAATASKAETLFIWTDRDGLRAGDQYRLVVQGENGKEYVKPATQETFVKLRLPPGTWHYFVMKQNRVTRDAPVASASRQLRVLDRTLAIQWRRLGRKAHELKRDETVLLNLR
ncbi:hypothetical protein [Oligoflexus tunisiensis]|uniref:hypothetical protein n=1 Tax=Oligoflexus tunisiensis TaxID=708132 RepID=UPI00114D2431|nr:hypothetical protein [Oligoflexus tunisiensis]